MYKLITIGGDGGLAAGQQGAFYNMLAEYHKYWERIDVLCPRSHRPAVATSFFGNVHLHCSPWLKIFQPWFIARRLRQLVKTQGADLIVVQEYAPFYNSLGLWLARIKHIPVSYELLHIVGYPRAGNIREQFYYGLNRWWLPRLLRRADLIRVMNREVEDWLLKRGIPAAKVQLIPAFYLDRTVFQPQPVDKIYDLVFFGRLARNKGIYLLLEALVLLKKQRSGSQLLLIGDGPEKNSIKKYVDRQNLQANVVWAGWLSDARAVAEHLNQAKIFVMPSYNEGGPRTLIEAMACGLPVVATAVGLAKELIQTGENGFLVDWSAPAIAVRCLQLLDDAALRARFSLAGLLISRQFDKNAALAHYAAAYHALIERTKTK